MDTVGTEQSREVAGDVSGAFQDLDRQICNIVQAEWLVDRILDVGQGLYDAVLRCSVASQYQR